MGTDVNTTGRSNREGARVKWIRGAPGGIQPRGTVVVDRGNVLVVRFDGGRAEFPFFENEIRPIGAEVEDLAGIRVRWRGSPQGPQEGIVTKHAGKVAFVRFSGKEYSIPLYAEELEILERKESE